MPPPEPIIQERVISGRGSFRLEDSFLNCRRILLYSSVIRMPQNRYLNKNWSPDQGQYANVTLCRDEYVGVSIAQKYEQQVFTLHENSAHQVGSSLVCALDEILDFFVQYLASLSVPYENNNPIKEFGYSSFLYNSVRFDCYSDTALSLRLVGELIEKCDPADAPPRFPPPPPRPPDRLPPGTPLSPETVPLSPPYPGVYPDEQVPFPGDEDLGDFPYGEACQQLRVRGNLLDVNGIGTEAQPIDVFILGEFEGFDFENTTNAGGFPLANLIFICGGDISGTCSPGSRVQVYGGFSRDATFELLSVVPS